MRTLALDRWSRWNAWTQRWCETLQPLARWGARLDLSPVFLACGLTKLRDWETTLDLWGSGQPSLDAWWRGRPMSRP